MECFVKIRSIFFKSTSTLSLEPFSLETASGPSLEPFSLETASGLSLDLVFSDFMIVWLNGKFEDARNAKVSVFDHGFLYADGVYETLRTYGGFVWKMEEHLRRLKRSAAMIGLRLPWNFEQLGEWIQETVRKNGFKESRIRVTVTRGENGFDFGDAKKPTLCIQVHQLREQPQVVYRAGVRVVIFRAERILPEAKTLNLLPMVVAQQFAAKKKAYETLLADAKGRVKEGTVTNFFLVKTGILITPGRGVLAGTTRDALLRLARRLGVKVLVRDVKLPELYEADEVFLTNAPRGIIPVQSIDARKIGKNCPGVMTKMLSEAFREKIEKFISGKSGRAAKPLKYSSRTRHRV